MPCSARINVCCYFFFFSSRRRHTRFSRDWSSDVCSSDLDDALGVDAEFLGVLTNPPNRVARVFDLLNRGHGAAIRQAILRCESDCASGPVVTGGTVRYLWRAPDPPASMKQHDCRALLAIARWRKHVEGQRFAAGRLVRMDDRGLLP